MYLLTPLWGERGCCPLADDRCDGFEGGFSVELSGGDD